MVKLLVDGRKGVAVLKFQMWVIAVRFRMGRVGSLGCGELKTP
jgi:hypothetical protein